MTDEKKGETNGQGPQEQGEERGHAAPGVGPEQVGHQENVPSADDRGALSDRIAELEDAHLRAKAENENLRKRMEQGMRHVGAYAVSSFALSLLEVRDALTAAIANKEKNLLEGVELTLKKLDTTLADRQVAEIGALGKRFDPELHEALGTREDADAEPNTVCEVLVSGFTIADRVLRPAKVIVSNPPEQGEKATDPAESPAAGAEEEEPAEKGGEKA